MMHSLNIFHRDIKPDNIVYSLRLKRPVLIDFGLAVHNPKSYHGRQFTGYCGTVKFMGEEMRGLAADREGYVDLARNDREALRRALEVLRRGCAQQKQTEEGKT
jgi:serine/threonine protein kinase